MSARLRRRALLVLAASLLAAVGLCTGVGSGFGPGIGSPETASAATTFTFDLYRPGVFTTQATWWYCTRPASRSCAISIEPNAITRRAASAATSITCTPAIGTATRQQAASTRRIPRRAPRVRRPAVPAHREYDLRQRDPVCRDSPPGHAAAGRADRRPWPACLGPHRLHVQRRSRANPGLWCVERTDRRAALRSPVPGRIRLAARHAPLGHGPAPVLQRLRLPVRPIAVG